MSLEIFSSRLKELMVLDGVSGRALAAKLGADRKCVRLWLKGKNFPRYDTLIKLSVCFKVRLQYLLGLENREGFQEKTGCALQDVPFTFKKRLTRYMQAQGLTKYALAKKINIDQKTLTKWFVSESMPETATLIKLARLMNESVDYLLGRE